MTLYVFDMDGTITPARQPMTAEFAIRFYEWQKTHKSFVATGSDYAKVEEQLPPSVIKSFTGVYCSMGNVLKSKSETVYQKDFEPSGKLLSLLEKYRSETEYPGVLYENYIERRVGMVNFSVLGRNCPYTERERYCAWDKVAHERLKIQAELKCAFPDLDVAVGGSISMDITPKGCGKEQIAHHLRATYPAEEIVFFGDKTFAGGNDYELARELTLFAGTKTVQADNPEFVLKYLEENT